MVQFRALSDRDYLDECAFRLDGVVTLVDTDRELVVLQDATAAVALHWRFSGEALQVGQRVTLEGTNCRPYTRSFPDYPYHPSGGDIRTTFEAPTNWGEYYLTRMRGYLHPAVSGEYTFWIASDNSSELWLSTNEDPSNGRRIAFVARYAWVAPREWSRFPSQRSEPIVLKAGETYYIEALQEQTTVGDHLAVAWQGPSLNRSIIDGRYLSPGGAQEQGDGPGSGILRDYWTNYSAGGLSVLTPGTPFQSALSAERVRVSIHGPGPLPTPTPILLSQSLRGADNYRWVQMEGRVEFLGVDGNVALLELSDGRAQIQVRALHWNPALSRRVRNAPVRVEGVCEGVYDQKGILVAGLIWASAENSISVVEAMESDVNALAPDRDSKPLLPDPGMRGFYATHGVVTFNDRVFDKDFLFVQEDAAAVFVSLIDRHFKNQLKIGQWVELGGALQPNKYLPVISPLAITELGWGSMPAPITEPIQFPVPGNREGRWTEVHGIVQSVNSNGTLSLMGTGGTVLLWIGQTTSNSLARYVDAKLRVRGVLSLAVSDVPTLLIPSCGFLNVEEESPPDPFGIPVGRIADLSSDLDTSSAHRTRLQGEVTYTDSHLFFMQDASGGIRVQTRDPVRVKLGDTVDVVGFPTASGAVRILSEPLVRSAPGTKPTEPRKLDLGEPFSSKWSDTLVQVNAQLLSQRTVGRSQVLELQQEQRVFAATLRSSEGRLPVLAPGSRLRITGVFDIGTGVLPVSGRSAADKALSRSPTLWLRRPADVVVLSGTPWWTWARAAVLIGALLTVLMIALLWVHLLRRRLERQQATQRMFSQQMLERLEGERHRIAANLHDSLGQTLLAIKNQALLALQRAPDEPALKQRLDEISGTTSQAIEEVRQITHGLRPYQLDRLGLTQAIRATAGRVATNSPILFAIRVEDIDGLFDKDSEIHVYRIVQEAVNNVVKHSAATEAAVVVKKRPTLISISIRDNGRGFDHSTALPSEPHDLGYGLSGIAERVRILEGTLVVDSHPGEGTSLSIDVPISAEKNDARNNHSDRG